MFVHADVVMHTARAGGTTRLVFRDELWRASRTASVDGRASGVVLGSDISPLSQGMTAALALSEQKPSYRGDLLVSQRHGG